MKALPPLKPLKLPCDCKDTEMGHLTICKLGTESIMNKFLQHLLDDITEGILTPNKLITCSLVKKVHLSPSGNQCLYLHG